MTIRERSTEETAIACRLTDDAFDRRRTEAGALFANATRITAIAGGVELAFAGDDETARTLLDFVCYERRCCPTLSYGLLFDKESRDIRLTMHGADGLADLVTSWRSARTGAMRASCAGA